MQTQRLMQPGMMVCSLTAHDVNPYQEKPTMDQFLKLVRSAADVANNAIEKAKNNGN
jgi:hypothetical protein